MRRFWRKAWAIVSVNHALMNEYRAEIVLWALSGLLPLVLMGVWMNVSRGGQFGMQPVDFARYFFAVFVIGQFTTVWVVWEFEGDVVEGRLSPLLLQPIDPVVRYLGMHVGERITRVVFIVLFCAVFFGLYPGAVWWPGWANLGTAMIVVALAFAMRFAMQYTVALVGFWTERASAIESLTFLCFMFLAGRIAPLAVYPEGLRRVLWWTPFPYIVDFPVTILLGHEADPWPKAAVMLGWLAFFILLNRITWRRGLRHYSAMGA
ncbi:MAG: ABC-2 family transporter protein [Planctomycetes bacterium]|nr:ABC-2 family transporter protein [Planctomycetota bacterium]